MSRRNQKRPKYKGKLRKHPCKVFTAKQVCTNIPVKVLPSSQSSVSTILTKLGVGLSLFPAVIKASSNIGHEMVACSNPEKVVFAGTLIGVPFYKNAVARNASSLLPLLAIADRLSGSLAQTFADNFLCQVIYNATLQPSLSSSIFAYGCTSNCDGQDFICGFPTQLLTKNETIARDLCVADVNYECIRCADNDDINWKNVLGAVFGAGIFICAVVFIAFCCTYFEIIRNALKQKRQKNISRNIENEQATMNVPQPQNVDSVDGEGDVVIEIRNQVLAKDEDSDIVPEEDELWPLSLIPKDVKLSDFNDPMQDYIKSFFNKAKNTEVIINASVKIKEALDVPKYVCLISRNVPNIPISFNGQLYDLYWLLTCAKKDGVKYIDPATNSYKFTLKELVVERDVQQQIEKILSNNHPQDELEEGDDGSPDGGETGASNSREDGNSSQACCLL
ncbi:MAG: hypothetical protein KAS93_07490 [Gammaproteobacteria bacterium]|nr:hypothetical protein [Gammaproteobacteria bacterium]